MPRLVYVTRLSEQYQTVQKKLAGWSPGEESAELKPIIVRKFEEGHNLLDAAADEAADERLEASQAADALDVLSVRSAPLFERIYHALVARFHEEKARGASANDSHSTDLDRFLQGFAPGAYRDATSRTQVKVLGEAVRLAEHFLTDKWQQLADEAAELHAEIEAALDVAEKEAGEADEADHARDEAFARSRVVYMSTRELLSAALRLDGSHDLLDKWAPPISHIRAPRGGSGSGEPADPLIEPDPQPEPA